VIFSAHRRVQAEYIPGITSRKQEASGPVGSGRRGPLWGAVGMGSGQWAKWAWRQLGRGMWAVGSGQWSVEQLVQGQWLEKTTSGLTDPDCHFRSSLFHILAFEGRAWLLKIDQ